MSPQAAQLTPEAAPERLYFLDWVRIIAFFILILYHVGMYYVTWGWHIKSPFASDFLEPLMMLSSPWRLGLLFMVSGVASSFMLKKQSPSRFAGSRSVRLLLPLVFGMAVIVPPQSYFEVVEKVSYAGSYSDFLQLYSTGYHGFCQEKCLRLPTWNHLWFVAYLWVYSLLLWGLMSLAPKMMGRTREGLTTWMQGWLIVILPVAYLALARMILMSDFPDTHALWGDWFNHATYLFLFLFGVLMGDHSAFWKALAKVRWRSLACALLGWCYMIAYMHYFNETREPSQAALFFQRLVYVFLAWNAILAACGFARQHLNFNHPARAYLSEAVFPVYILHQSLIIIIAFSLKSWRMMPIVEGPILIALTLLLSFMGFEIVRRIKLLRPLFGLSWARRH